MNQALILSILAGQLIKFPLFGNQGPTILDIFVFIFVLIGAVKSKFKLKPPPNFIISGIAFISICIISLMFTPLKLTVSEYTLSFLYILRFSLMVSSAWIIYSDIFPSFRKNINIVITQSGVGLAILGLCQFIIFPNLQFIQALGWDPHYLRTVSTFLDPNFTGAFLCLTLILLIANNKLKHVFFYLTYIALLTTFSRSSYLMFLISSLMLSFLQKSKKLAITCVILFLLLLLGFQIYTQIVAKPRNIDREKSASFRLTTWQQGLTLFQKFPILGIGFNSYRYALRQYDLGENQFLESRGSTSNDSSLLSVMATTGVLGAISYLLFLISLIKWGLKQNIVLVSGLVGLFIHSVFANSLFYSPILLWIMFISVVPKK